MVFYLGKTTWQGDPLSLTLDFDPDATNYITRVELADGQALETAVKRAINKLFIGLKAAGILSTLGSTCILAGARTLAGALVPLLPTMATPTNFGFVAGDFNRVTGLKGSGTKYLDTNYLTTETPQDSFHQNTWLSEYTSGDQYLTGQLSSSVGAASFLLARNDAAFFRNRFNGSGESVFATGSQFEGGMFGASRNASNNVNYSFRQDSGQATGALATPSAPPTAETVFIYRAGNAYSDCRLSYFSVGANVNLITYESLIKTLTADLAAALS